MHAEGPSISAFRRWCRDAGITYSITDTIDDLKDALEVCAPMRLREELEAVVPTLTRRMPMVRERPASAPQQATSLLIPTYDPRGAYTDATSEPERLRQAPVRPQSASHHVRPAPLRGSGHNGEATEVAEEDGHGAEPDNGDPSWLPPPAHRHAPRAPPTLQVVLSRVIASSQHLALEVDRQSRGTSSRRAGLEGARLTALRTHIDALVSMKGACLDAIRRAEAEVRDVQEQMVRTRRESVLCKQENSRLRWALTTDALTDMKEEAALAFMSAGDVVANKTAVADKMAHARELAAFQHQLDEALSKTEHAQGELAHARAEMTTLRAERDGLLSLKRKAELEAQRAVQQLRSMGVEFQYKLALDTRARAQEDKERAAEEAAYRMLMHGELEEAKAAFTALLAQHRDLEFEMAARLANRVPAGRILKVRGIAAYNVPDLDDRRGSQVSDPYVCFTLLDADGNWIDATTTTHKRNSHNPSWSEQHMLMMPHDMAMPASLVVTLWDKDWHQADTVIAKGRLELRAAKGHVLQELPHSSQKPITPRKKANSKMPYEGKLMAEFTYETSEDMFFDPPEA